MIKLSKDKRRREKHKEKKKRQRKRKKAGVSGSDPKGNASDSSNNHLSIIAVDSEKVNSDTPYEWLMPEGILQVLMAHAESCSTTSFALFNLAGAINLLGHIIGQRVKGPTGCRTNFYNVVIGHSSSGKEAPAKACKYLVQAGEFESLRLVDDITSGAALLRTMDRRGPIMFLYLDELGKTFKAAQGKGSSQGDLIPLLMKMYSKTDTYYEKQYAQATDSFSIDGPHLNLLGTTTPNQFYTALSGSDIANGFLPRCLFFPSEHAPLAPNFDVQRTGEKRIIDNLLNLTNIGDEGKPLAVPENDEANRLRKKWTERCREKHTAVYKNDVLGAIFGKTCEHGLKLSLLHSVSRFGADPNVIIEPIDCNWGFSLAEASANWLADAASNFTGSDKHQQNVNVVYSIIKNYQETHDGAPCPGRHLQRRLHMKVYDLNNIIETLKAAEQVHVKQKRHKNGTVTQGYSITG